MTDKKETAVTTKEKKFMENTQFGKGGLIIKSFDDLWEFSQLVAKSKLCPEQYRGNPGDVFIAIEWGFELGLTPMNALNSIIVIDGKPTLWGDAVKGLVDNSRLMEYYNEEIIGCEYDDDFGYKITSRRKDNHSEITTYFTVRDAKKAGLWDNPKKQYTWGKYPKRMLKVRARAFNLRDNFPEVLKGIRIYEEVVDYEEVPKPKSLNEIMDETLTALDDDKIDPEITAQNEAEKKEQIESMDEEREAFIDSNQTEIPLGE